MSIGGTIIPTKPTVEQAGLLVAKPETPSESFWGEDGFTFGDIVDAINPLKHIPVISSIYNELTKVEGEPEISKGSKMLGGTLFGLGFVGLISSFVSDVFETTTGDSIGGHILSFLRGESTPTTAIAATKGAGEVAILSKPSQKASELAFSSVADKYASAASQLNMIAQKEREESHKINATGLLI